MDIQGSKTDVYKRQWLQIGLNVSGTHSVQDYPKQDDSTISNVVTFARSVPSFYPVYQRDLTTGAYLLDENGNRMFDYGAVSYTHLLQYRLTLIQTGFVSFRLIKKNTAGIIIKHRHPCTVSE